MSSNRLESCRMLACHEKLVAGFIDERQLGSTQSFFLHSRCSNVWVMHLVSVIASTRFDSSSPETNAPVVDFYLSIVAMYVITRRQRWKVVLFKRYLFFIFSYSTIGEDSAHWLIKLYFPCSNFSIKVDFPKTIEKAYVSLDAQWDIVYPTRAIFISRGVRNVLRQKKKRKFDEKALSHQQHCNRLLLLEEIYGVHNLELPPTILVVLLLATLIRFATSFFQKKSSYSAPIGNAISKIKIQSKEVDWTPNVMIPSTL